MRRGPWHQFGDRSQALAIEQLQQGAGVGVIISPRDLALHSAVEYAQRYHGLSAHVLIDPQFYVPHFTNKNMSTYPIDQHRRMISEQVQIADKDISSIASELYKINQVLSTDGVIAPALVYDAGRNDIIQLNRQLFEAAKQAGNQLGVPTYATVILGRSAATSEQSLNTILSHATALECDGFYYGFEFSPERIPSSRDEVFKCCKAGLTLACCGLPILHAYAGPMAMLSLGFGATGTAIGHSQNLWRFTRTRWYPPAEQGGGGAAPPRFFSSSLWGTIIYPDEVSQLDASIRSQVLTLSPFSTQVSSSQPFLTWPRWQANKHIVHTICSVVSDIASNSNSRVNANDAIARLDTAVMLHSNIASRGVVLRDNTNTYQRNWQSAMNDIVTRHNNDYDYLDLLS